MPAGGDPKTGDRGGASETVRAVICGDVALSALRPLGLTVRSKPDFVLTPAIEDLAAGLLKYARKRGGRKRWADLIIHAQFIDLRPERDNPAWDTLMGALWDALSGLEIAPEAVDAARRVLDRTGLLASPKRSMLHKS